MEPMIEIRKAALDAAVKFHGRAQRNLYYTKTVLKSAKDFEHYLMTGKTDG